MQFATFRGMAAPEPKSPSEQLGELRKVLSVPDIAEFTGLRQEMSFQARTEGFSQDSTEKAVGVLHTLVSRVEANGGDLDRLTQVLRRIRPALGGRSIAGLIRDGEMDRTLDFLPLLHAEVEQPRGFRVDPVAVAELRAAEGKDELGSTDSIEWSRRRVDALISSDPELSRGLEAIEAAVREHFGRDVVIKREVVVDDSHPGAKDRIYLRLHSGLPFSSEVDQLAELFEDAGDLIAPLEDRVTVGNL